MLHGILDPEPGKLVLALFDGTKQLHRAECAMRPRDQGKLGGIPRPP